MMTTVHTPRRKIANPSMSESKDEKRTLATEPVAEEAVVVPQPSRKRRRAAHWIVCAVVMVLCTWHVVMYASGAKFERPTAFDVTVGSGSEISRETNSTDSAEYPPVPDLVRVGVLPEDYKPDHHEDKRLIIVGDVHGNLKYLKKLLKKAHFVKGRDHLVMCGDFITKGPDSFGVLDFAMDIGAACVRGNHEDEVLNLYSEYHGLPAPKVAPPQYDVVAAEDVGDVQNSEYDQGMDSDMDNDHDDHDDTDTDNDHEHHRCGGGLFGWLRGLHNWGKRVRSLARRDDASIRGPTDELVARHLEAKHVEYLGTCPSILQLGNVTRHGVQAVAVHGGLMWNIEDLQQQDPAVVMRVRTALPPDWTKASEDDDGRPWTKLWNKHQKSKHNKADRLQVFYGHDARSGLNIQKYTKGLDSGCVKGGQLSAIVVKHKHNGKYSEKLIQVDCD